MERRQRRRFTPEYKAEVVALIRGSGKPVGQVSRDLGLTETSVRERVQKAEIEAPTSPKPAGLHQPAVGSAQGRVGVTNLVALLT